MKPTIKVSIGGYAFNLEESAYQIVDDYLKTLAKYFSNNPEGKEIISDVEMRMAELLQMRMETPDSVIDEKDARAIISIMGSPKDFGEEEDTGNETMNSGSQSETKTKKKRLYRDSEHGIIGGVCSGLGYYLKIDPVIIRIIFVLVFFIINFTFNNESLLVILLYIVLWIAMPKARTFSQKLEMTGEDPSIEDIESRNISSMKPKQSGIVKFIKVFFGIIIGLVCLSILIAIIAIVAAFFGFYGKSDMPEVNIFLELYDIYSLDLKIAMVMASCLPLIGLVYLCLKLLLQSKFTSRDLVISCIAFILWIGSLFYAGGVISGIVKDHESRAVVTQNISVETRADTLYVNIGDEYARAKSFFNNNYVFYMKNGEDDYSIYISPEVYVKYDSTLTDFKVEIEKKGFDQNRKLATNRAKNAQLNYSVQDSMIIIRPQLYNKKHLWDRQLFKLIITVPKNKGVVVDEALNTNNIFYSEF